MALHHADLILTKCFTPKEAQVEVFEKACKQNVVVSLVSTSGKNFIYSKVIEHFINFSTSDRQILCTFCSPAAAARHANRTRRLSCFTVAEINSSNLTNQLPHDQILFTTVDIATEILENGTLPLQKVSLITLFDCHSLLKDSRIDKVLIFILLILFIY